MNVFLFLLLLLLLWHGPLTNLQLFRDEIEKKTGTLSEERKEERRKKEIS
jgi:hypothetical protein